MSRLVGEHGSYAKHIYQLLTLDLLPTSSKLWRDSTPDIIKLNADASLAVEGWVGLGIVARNSVGDVLFSSTRIVKAFWAPEVAGAKAIAFALKLGHHHGFEKIMVESDCQVNAISYLSKHAIFLSDLDFIFHDILSVSIHFQSVVSWSHVKRDGNYVAHHLAKLILFGVEQVWERHCPIEVVSYVLADSQSFNE